ncbi:ornithine cyclodeaminase family protein [Streptomyces sp. NPDC059894]|uniref:ornithine cyclodeaminase family protein n=1 Tax=unclassified Streptomyces TaxID=2593676 RepID=UPI00364D0548
MNLARIPRIDEATLGQLVPMGHAIAVVEKQLRDGLPESTDGLPRSAAHLDAGQLLFMPALLGGYAGVKLAAVAPGNVEHGLPRVTGVYVLLDAQTLVPLALLDGAALTALRTPAVSAVAVGHLAVADAARVVVFGTGPQAWRHVEAVRAVRPITHVDVVGRHAGRTHDFVARCADTGLTATASGADAVEKADIVLCCTSSATPLFPGTLIPRHATVVAVGSHEPAAREVDTQLVRASTVVVERRSAALREAGDLLIPLHAGDIRADHIAGDLVDLVAGRVRTTGTVPRLFKSVGMAWEDLLIAAAAYELRRADSDLPLWL